jgi:phenylalanine-4-hydroxylase
VAKPATSTATTPTKAPQPAVAVSPQPKKEEAADLTPIPANISFEDLSAQLNLIADRSQKSSNKKSTRSKIIRMCESEQVYVKLFSESNTLVDRYAIKDYLSRIDLLGRYKIEVMSFDKNDNSQIIEIRVRETRI